MKALESFGDPLRAELFEASPQMIAKRRLGGAHR
jgi:hypothetical protein